MRLLMSALLFCRRNGRTDIYINATTEIEFCHLISYFLLDSS